MDARINTNPTMNGAKLVAAAPTALKGFPPATKARLSSCSCECGMSEIHRTTGRSPFPLPVIRHRL
jgi:hypothetical protein